MSLTGEILFRSLLLCGAMLPLAIIAGRRRLEIRSQILAWTTLLLILLPASFLLPRIHLDLLPVDPSTAAAGTSTSSGHLLAWALSLVWTGGAVILLLARAAGYARLRQWISRAAPATASNCLYELDAVRRELGFRRNVRLLISPDLTSPAAFLHRGQAGILLPQSAAGWSRERIRVVLLHEVAHLVRGDLWRQWIDQLLTAVYWFNPLVWILERMRRESREFACDALVVSRGTPPASYANHLLDIATTASHPSPALVGMASSRSSIAKRIERLFLKSAAPKRACSCCWTGSLLFLATAGIALATLGLTLAPSSHEEVPSPTAVEADALLRLTADPFPGN